MSQLNNNLVFEDLVKVLIRMGYRQGQPKSGSGHYTFKKDGRTPITLPKTMLMNKSYIEMVRDAIMKCGNEAD